MKSPIRRASLFVSLLLVPVIAACSSGSGPSSPTGVDTASPTGVVTASASPSSTSSQIPDSTERPATATPVDILSVTEIVERAEPAVVRISVPGGVGTGIIIGAGGEIVTNNHVITDNAGNPADNIGVLLSDGTNLSATILGRDPRSDLAVLKIDGSGYSTIPLGTLSEVKVGQDVIAIGFALDLSRGEGPSFSVTRGIISAKNRGIRESSDILGAIQTDAAINPGNSGGPLLNFQGEVVGINTAIAPDRITGGVAFGIGFAVGVDTIRAVFEEIMVNGSVDRGQLGILNFEALRPAQARDLGLPEDTTGVYLDAESDVAPGLPAAQAGMREDDVIISINGHAVRTEADLAVALIYSHAGETVPVEVYRQGSVTTLQVTLGTPGFQ